MTPKNGNLLEKEDKTANLKTKGGGGKTEVSAAKKHKESKKRKGKDRDKEKNPSSATLSRFYPDAKERKKILEELKDTELTVNLQTKLSEHSVGVDCDEDDENSLDGQCLQLDSTPATTSISPTAPPSDPNLPKHGGGPGAKSGPGGKKTKDKDKSKKQEKKQEATEKKGKEKKDGQKEGKQKAESNSLKAVKNAEVQAKVDKKAGDKVKKDEGSQSDKKSSKSEKCPPPPPCPIDGPPVQPQTEDQNPATTTNTTKPETASASMAVQYPDRFSNQNGKEYWDSTPYAATTVGVQKEEPQKEEAQTKAPASKNTTAGTQFEGNLDSAIQYNELTNTSTQFEEECPPCPTPGPRRASGTAQGQKGSYQGLSQGLGGPYQTSGQAQRGSYQSSVQGQRAPYQSSVQGPKSSHQTSGQVQGQGGPYQCSGQAQGQGGPYQCSGQAQGQGGPYQCSGQAQGQGGPYQCSGQAQGQGGPYQCSGQAQGQGGPYQCSGQAQGQGGSYQGFGLRQGGPYPAIGPVPLQLSLSNPPPQKPPKVSKLKQQREALSPKSAKGKPPPPTPPPLPTPSKKYSDTIKTDNSLPPCFHQPPPYISPQNSITIPAQNQNQNQFQTRNQPPNPNQPQSQWKPNLPPPGGGTGNNVIGLGGGGGIQQYNEGRASEDPEKGKEKYLPNSDQGACVPCDNNGKPTRYMSKQQSNGRNTYSRANCDPPQVPPEQNFENQLAQSFATRTSPSATYRNPQIYQGPNSNSKKSITSQKRLSLRRSSLQKPP